MVEGEFLHLLCCYGHYPHSWHLFSLPPGHSWYFFVFSSVLAKESVCFWSHMLLAIHVLHLEFLFRIAYDIPYFLPHRFRGWTWQGFRISDCSRFCGPVRCRHHFASPSLVPALPSLWRIWVAMGHCLGGCHQVFWGVRACGFWLRRPYTSSKLFLEYSHTYTYRFIHAHLNNYFSLEKLCKNLFLFAINSLSLTGLAKHFSKMVRFLHSSVFVGNLHSSLLYELVKLYNHAVAPYLPRSFPGWRPFRGHPHCPALHHQFRLRHR